MSARATMTPAPVPVILVHGWNSHPGAWNRLGERLDAAGIPSARFDHSALRNADLAMIARELGAFIAGWRRQNDHAGPVDLVCHSVGTCITRYLLEVLDREARQEQVRQLIALGPPNNGSALAELFVDPDQGPALIRHLTGIFVPPGFDPAADAIVQDVRLGSVFMRRLRTAGVRPDIIYRIIVTANPSGDPAFFPLFEGKTWELAGPRRYTRTLLGDGIVAHTESTLPGISLDIIGAGENGTRGHVPSVQYCHIQLTKNPEVCDRVLRYLTGQDR